jgi:hypothetical protein
MAIVTNKNRAYGPPNVTDKYAPLAGPAYDIADRPIYTGLLNNRMAVLRHTGLIGERLQLTVPNWANTVTSEAGHLPPLVVVSSNRARWIRSGIDASVAELALNRGLAAFNGVSDLRAVLDRHSSHMSPPLYAPNRIGANRNVYVVVNIAEYKFYKTQLAGTGITPVGWNFAKTSTAQRDLSMLGFGATRFAAMEFCKTLRRQAATAAGSVAPWNSAWIIDDNTVALGNFAGFAAVEAALGGRACAGFHGSTSADPQVDTQDWATREIAAGRGLGPALALPVPLARGIVQQTALWNIDYFDTNHLNFGPLYITSAEDLSIAKHFDNAAIPYLFYNGINVIKEIPAQDDGHPAAKVNKGRQALARLVTAAESATPPIGTPPPPVHVQPAELVDGGVQTLSDFIVNRVLPNASETIRAQAGNADTQAQAKCQAVEQLTCGALGHGFVNNAAIAATFQINGAAQQVVERRDLP